MSPQDLMRILRSEVLTSEEANPTPRVLGTLAPGTRGHRIYHLIELADWLEYRRRRPLEDIIQEFDAEDLRRICVRLGVEAGDEEEPVQRLVELVGSVQRGD